MKVSLFTALSRPLRMPEAWPKNCAGSFCHLVYDSRVKRRPVHTAYAYT